MKKLFTFSSPSFDVTGSTLSTMHSLGILPFIGFPAATSDDDVNRFFHYFRRCKDLLPEVTTVLQGLLRNKNDVEEIALNFRLSKLDKLALNFLVRHRKLLPNEVTEENKNKLISQLEYLAEHGTSGLEATSK